MTAMGMHRPRKRYGQNFLVDRGIVAKILASIDPKPEDRVVEIGPGLGVLTEPLLERLPSLDVVEIDRDLAAVLAERFPPDRLRVHVGDALAFDFCALGSELRVIGNLPYNISTPLLFHLAASAQCLRDCHFMLQREVVQRMAALPGGKEYGRLTVMLQYRFQVEKLLRVSAGAFNPVPQVESAFVRLTPYRQLPSVAVDENLFAELVRAAFTQRRKTLRNALRDHASGDELSGLGIDPGLRPERLSVKEFVQIANAVTARNVNAGLGASGLGVLPANHARGR
jgi:16S rRNA (adenine1518-N6/adenine1519-N6)-dimethyltransferase